jgi:casein kinase 1
MVKALKQLNLANQSALRALRNTIEGHHGEDAKINSLEQRRSRHGKTSESSVIDISSDAEVESLMPARSHLPKATRLNMLTTRASNAKDNATLAALVKEFVDVMKMNSSRTLTREAFGFLDVLFKQLDDPSVFIGPKRFELRVL